MTQLKALGNPPHILKAPHGAFWRNKKPPRVVFKTLVYI